MRTSKRVGKKTWLRRHLKMRGGRRAVPPFAVPFSVSGSGCLLTRWRRSSPEDRALLAASFASASDDIVNAMSSLAGSIVKQMLLVRHAQCRLGVCARVSREERAPALDSISRRTHGGLHACSERGARSRVRIDFTPLSPRRPASQEIRAPDPSLGRCSSSVRASPPCSAATDA